MADDKIIRAVGKTGDIIASEDAYALTQAINRLCDILIRAGERL